MASVRKLERLMVSLKSIEKFAQNIPEDTAYGSITMYIQNLEGIHNDVAETLDSSANVEAADHIKYWDTMNKAFFEIMPLLIKAKEEREPRNHTSDNLQSTLIDVLEGQKTFFEQLPVSLQTQSHNRGIKVPALNIEVFSGGEDYDKWPPFYDIFKTSVHDNKSISTVHKFSLLRSHLKDEARDLISHLLVTEENYNIAWDKICKRYNKPKKIASSYINRFFDIPAIHQISSKGLRSITDVADEQLRGLDALGSDYSTRDPWLVSMLLSKVDSETRRMWSEQSSDKMTFSISELLEFLTKRCDSLEDSQTTKVASTSKPKHTKSFHTEVHYNRCPNCSENHSLFRCFKFLALDLESKRNLVKKLEVCFNCLKKNHTTINCFSKLVCQICKKKHHTLLHSPQQPQIQAGRSTSVHIATNDSHLIHNTDEQFLCQNDSQATIVDNAKLAQLTTESTQSISNYHINLNNQTLLPTVQAFVKDSSGNLKQVRALLDSASMSSFITENCVQALGLSRTHACVAIDALSCTTAGSTRGQVELILSNNAGNGTSMSLNAFILKKITSRLPECNIDISEWHTLKNLKLADPKFNRSSSVDMLIGVDLFYLLQCPTPIMKITQDVIAQETVFGWVIAGQSSINYNKSKSFTVTPKPLPTDYQSQLNHTLQNFWKLEEVPSYSKINSDDEKIEKHFLANLERDESGKFTVRLPLNDSITSLGNSKSAAMSRLFAIERKFQQNSSLYDEYRKFMSEYIQLGHMEEIDDRDCNVVSNKLYYLPHHAVIKGDSLTTKTRVVFDGSCKTDTGISLNDCLLAGPTIQRDLSTILLNFRSYNVAFISDVEKMYRMVNVHSADRDYQRILWRNNSSEPVKTYRLSTVTYGTTCAPYLAIRALNEIAVQNKSTHPLAAQRIQEDFYVDDLLSGSYSVHEAVKLKHDISTALQSYGMHLRKWSSNSSEFMSSISCNATNSNELELIDQVSNPTIKTLGLHWCTGDDIFSFKVYSTNEIHTTKRQILSYASKIFDPLGWLTPSTVTIKIFLQSLWLTKLDWDDELPNQLIDKWKRIQTNLHKLEKVKIPRCLQMMNGSKQYRIQIHGFSDASESAYGAVVYFKIFIGSSSSVHLVAAKSKVAPLKQVTLARLELCAALLLSKLTKWILDTFNKFTFEIYAYSDSTIVLAWLDSHPRKWSNFIANRTSKILEIISRQHWRHVDSKSNPADLTSRGVDSKYLFQNTLWWDGPTWLKDDETDWPININPKLPAEIPELKTKNLALTTNISHNPTVFELFCNKFSSFEKIKRIICIFDRFLEYLQGDNPTPFILASELKAAESKLIRWAQKQAYSTEIELLKKGGNVPKSNPISCLMPFVDEDGILRVGGRLKNALIPYQRRHPIILPKNHIVSLRIVEELHIRYLHTGTSTLLSLLRRQYWIMSCRSLVKSIVHKCVKCFRERLRLCAQLMGNLPQERVVPTRPFLHTGIDYAGPLNIRSNTGRGRIQFTKGYIALFICYASKAIHLELVTSMSTEAFIATLQRFVNRRGLPLVIHSDCGTNFVGAERELFKLFTEFKNSYKEKLIYDFAATHLINFKFNPPSAPHFGGLWESNVKSVKTHLKRVTANACLTYEETSTLLVQIEGLLNSRPISPASDDIEDVNVLTPGHFLIGDAILAIPEPSYLDVRESYLSKWQNIQKRLQGFWKLWSTDYITSLQQRPKWRVRQANLEVGNLVLIKDENLPPSRWLLARITELHPGSDGLVRVALLKTKNGELKRPIVKLAKVPV